MKTKHYIAIAAVLLAAAGCGSGSGDKGGLVVFDYKQDYPATTLTLADIASIEYIRIGKSDDFLMSGNINAKAGET